MSHLCHARSVQLLDPPFQRIRSSVPLLRWTAQAFYSARSQYLQAPQGLIDRACAFPCCLPGRCWISNLYVAKSSNHLASCSCGFLKFNSRWSALWSVRMRNVLPYRWWWKLCTPSTTHKSSALSHRNVVYDCLLLSILQLR